MLRDSAGRRSLQPRLDRPLALWRLFPLLFVVVYLLHLTLLRLPYYWDEAGYYIPAAYDFFRTGALIPYSTLANGHPPLPSIYLSLWWLASGFTPAITRTSITVVAAFGLLAVFRLALRLTSRIGVAAATTLLTMIYPVWFAQSTLAHADIFAAAGTLWGLVYFFRADHRLREQEANRSKWLRSAAASAIWFSLAALAKETAIVTPVAMALWVGYRRLRTGADERSLRLAYFLIIPILPLVAWYGYYWSQTGFLFGNPQYWQYNAGSTTSPLRIVAALGHRIFDITAHMNMFVPVLCALGSLMLAPRLGRDGLRRQGIAPRDQAVLYVVLVTNLLFFSAVGGALLTRYLLPLYPLVLLLAVSAWRRRVRYWWGLVLLGAAAFVLGLFINPPYQFAPEDNLTYATMIRLEQKAIGQLEKQFPGQTVLTAWPVTDELSKPYLGYVKRPIPVVAVDNFSVSHLQHLSAKPADYSAMLAFSTKYVPRHPWLGLGGWNRALDKRYFGFHRDLSAGRISEMLGGTVVWRTERKGMWVALLAFDHAGKTAGRPADEPDKNHAAANYNQP